MEHNFRCAKTASSRNTIYNWVELQRFACFLACSQFNISTNALHPPVIASLFACLYQCNLEGFLQMKNTTAKVLNGKMNGEPELKRWGRGEELSRERERER